MSAKHAAGTPIIQIEGVHVERDFIFTGNEIHLPPEPPPPRDQRWLDELRGFVEREVEQWLTSELQGGPLFRPDKEELSEVVGRRRPVLMGASDDRLLDSAEPLGDVFAEEAGRSLLILGEPGAGKSVLLRRLARDLVARAAAGDPVPVLLDLAGWRDDGRTFVEWLASADGLRRSYRSFGHEQLRSWLREGRLTLLLDGLDEVRADERVACIAAINAFVAGEGGGAPGGLAVCCRLDEYLRLAQEAGALDLGAAIYLRPLTDAQVRQYIDAVGPAARPLRAAWEADEGVREFARNPFMLNTMRLAFERGVAAPAMNAREQLLDAYVDRVFERADERVAEHSANGRAVPSEELDQVFEHVVSDWASGTTSSLPFTQAEVTSRLAWLASELHAHAKNTFYVEEVQPSWVDGRQRAGYVLLSRSAGGLLMGTVTGALLLFGLGVSGTLFGFDEAAATGGLVLALSLVGALAASGLDALRILGRVPLSRVRVLSLAVLTISMGGAGALLFAVWGLRMMYGLLFGVLWGVVVAVVFEPGAAWRTAEYDIRLVEPLRWSRRRAARAALRGLGVGAVAGGALGGLIAWAGSGGASWEALIVVSAIGTAALATVVGGAMGGLEHGNVHAEPRHNLGLRLSVRNAAFAGAVTAFAATVTFFPLVLASGAFMSGTAVWWSLGSGLFCGTLAALRYGGLNAVYHATLRVLLYRAGRLPLGAEPFFRYVTDLTLIRAAGGGYAFAHRYFADYFASHAAEPGPGEARALTALAPTERRPAET